MWALLIYLSNTYSQSTLTQMGTRLYLLRGQCELDWQKIILCSGFRLGCSTYVETWTEAIPYLNFLSLYLDGRRIPQF